jgi:hypothetical protein
MALLAGRERDGTTRRLGERRHHSQVEGHWHYPRPLSILEGGGTTPRGGGGGGTTHGLGGRQHYPQVGREATPPSSLSLPLYSPVEALLLSFPCSGTTPTSLSPSPFPLVRSMGPSTVSHSVPDPRALFSPLPGLTPPRNTNLLSHLPTSPWPFHFPLHHTPIPHSRPSPPLVVPLLRTTPISRPPSPANRPPSPLFCALQNPFPPPLLPRPRQPQQPAGSGGGERASRLRGGLRGREENWRRGEGEGRPVEAEGLPRPPDPARVPPAGRGPLSDRLPLGPILALLGPRRLFRGQFIVHTLAGALYPSHRIQFNALRPVQQSCTPERHQLSTTQRHTASRRLISTHAHPLCPPPPSSPLPSPTEVRMLARARACGCASAAQVGKGKGRSRLRPPPTHTHSAATRQGRADDARRRDARV